MKYLPDTNVWVLLLRHNDPKVLARLKAHDVADVLVSSVVAGELYAGAHKSERAAENVVKIQELTACYATLSFDIEEARKYGELRAVLEKRGTPIGPYDLQLAASALQHGLTLVTHNLHEFRRVPGLLIEDWQT